MFFREDPQDAPGLPTGYIQKLLKPPKSSKVYDESFRLPYRKNLTPVAGGKDREMIEAVKNEIFKEIVGKRIYKNEDLLELFGKAKKAYSNINRSVVESAIQKIKTDFEL